MPVLAIVVIVFFVVLRNVAAAAGTSKGAKKPLPKVSAPKRETSSAAGHLCEDSSSHKMTFGAAGDDLTAEVEEMNRRNNSIKSRGPLRLRTMTAEDIAAKKRELKSLLDGGIIDAEEYRIILREYENSMIF